MRSAAEDTALAAVFMAAVEVDSAVAAASTAVAGSVAVAGTTAVVVVSVEGIVAAASEARDLMAEAPIEAARSWAAEALHLMDPADSRAASILLVADTLAAADTVLTMRSRTATGILLVAHEAPLMREVLQDFAIPQLRMADGTRLAARAQVQREDSTGAAASVSPDRVWATGDSIIAGLAAEASADADSEDLVVAGAAAGVGD